MALSSITEEKSVVCIPLDNNIDTFLNLYKAQNTYWCTFKSDYTAYTYFSRRLIMALGMLAHSTSAFGFMVSLESDIAKNCGKALKENFTLYSGLFKWYTRTFKYARIDLKVLTAIISLIRHAYDNKLSSCYVEKYVCTLHSVSIKESVILWSLVDSIIYWEYTRIHGYPVDVGNNISHFHKLIKENCNDCLCVNLINAIEESGYMEQICYVTFPYMAKLELDHCEQACRLYDTLKVEIRTKK